MENATQIWTGVRSALAGSLSEMDLRCWIDPVRPVRFEGDRLVATVPSRWHRDRVRRYDHELGRTLSDLVGRPMSLVLEVSAEAGRLRTRRAPRALDEGPTFSSFLRSPGNVAAWEGARRFAVEDDGEHCFWIEGPTASGKTHLGRAMLAERRRRGAPVSSATLVPAGEIRDFERSVRLLVVDGLERALGKPRLLANVLRVVDRVIHAHGRVVFLSSRPLEEAPRSVRDRIAKSHAHRIEPPDLDLRLALARMESREKGVDLEETALQWIAVRARGGAREIAGWIRRLEVGASASAGPMGVEETERILAPLCLGRARASLDEIRQAVDRSALPTRYRDRVGMALARRFLGMTLQDVGSSFGKRSGSTVRYALRSVDERCRADPSFALLVASIEAEIGS